MKMRWAALVAATMTLALRGGAAVNQSGKTRPAVAFDWMANGTQGVSQETRRQRAREAVIRARALNKGATWVCSPAGFGKKSRCHRG